MVGKKKPAKVVDGNDFAKVYLKYGLERLVEEGHYSVEELSFLDGEGWYAKRLLSDRVFRRRLEEAGLKRGEDEST